MKTPIYRIREKVWLYPAAHSMTGWHFVNVSKRASKEIKELFDRERRGFGSVRVKATVRKTTWNTSVFPDKKTGGYILPLKADVRRKEDIRAGEMLHYSIEIML